MKGFLFFIALCVAHSSCYAQKTDNPKKVINFPTTKNDSLKKEINHFIQKVSSIEFIEILPVCGTYSYLAFNEDEITGKLVREIEEIEDCDYSTIIFKDSVPFKLKKERIINRRAKLKPKDSLQLYKLLYHNMDLYNEFVSGQCYNPANGIFFYDEKDKLIGFIELCFSCSNYTIAGFVPKFKSFSTLQYNQLEEIFREYNFLEQ